MKNQTIAVALTVFTCATQAAAQQVATPTISETPMAGDAAIPGASSEGPSDLPAPQSRSWVNKPLLVTGGSLLVAGYVPALVISQTGDRPVDKDTLRYPVVGPWMNLMDRGCDERECNNESTNKGLLIADGVVQGVGALGVILSLLLPGKTTQNWYLIGETQVAPMYIAKSTYGLGAMGKF
jgi:hypothetical protein